MIEQVQGNLAKKSPTFCIINCHGIGIGVHISLNTYQYLGKELEEVRLLTYLHVREDALQLFGFGEEEERAAFRKLISISGIGPRLAMIILSGLTVDEFSQAVVTGNDMVLTKIPGVGKKTAQRVILELKEKIELSKKISDKDFPVKGAAEQEKFKEATLALISLGYKQQDANRSVEMVAQKFSADIPLQEIIRLALKEI
jgi:Holliday junction DNA helicase RuvA